MEYNPLFFFLNLVEYNLDKGYATSLPVSGVPVERLHPVIRSGESKDIEDVPGKKCARVVTILMG